jgi:polar amino acid transport system substrate-binding protein
MDIAFTDMEFGALIPYVVSGKADLAIANISITEERKKSVLFTDSIYDERGGIITLKQNASATPERSPDITDYFGKTIGIPTGYVFDTMIENDFSGTVAYYSETSAGIEDVRQNRITGFMTDLSIARVIANQPGNSDLMVVPVPETYFSGPLGAISANADMINRFNSFIAELDSDGTLAKMQQFWLEDNPGSDPPMPDISASGSGTKEILKVAIGSGSIPFCYIGADGEIKGLCAELIRRFAARENMEAAFTAMEFSALIPYIASGKADIGIDAITITEERKKSVLFSEPFYYDHAGIIIVKPTVTEASNEIPITDQKGFIKWLQTGIERNLLIDNRWKMIVDGLRVTMTIAVFAQLLGTAFGCFVCWLLTRKNRFTQLIGNAYCGLIHGTPIVVLLMITYYIIFGDTNISNVLIAIAAFTMITGAEVAGNLKGSIDTIDPVEIEAARSIGFSAFKAFMTVTLPQAIRRSLPGYTKGFVELVKATAIVGYIAIQDLTRAGDIIRSRTYDAYFPLLFVAVIYLLVTTICVQLFKLIIRKINGGYMQ